MLTLYIRCFLLINAFMFSSLIEAQTNENIDQPKAIMVFDASNSMWGQINDKSKIEIAKEVVDDVLSDWDSRLHLGLTVYGHRNKGDCNDIESLINVSAVDKEKFLSELNKIRPKGKTPLTQAVKNAAEELRYTKDKATVILISDGVETCNQDPCTISKQLEESGIDFTAHVIGFDVNNPEEQEQLSCIANNTGGTYLNADNAEALKISLKELVSKVVSSISDVQIKAVRTGTNEAVKKPIRWTITAKKDNQDDSETPDPIVFDGNMYSGELAVGEYEVKAEVDGVVTTEQITIEKEGQRTFNLPLDLGLLAPQALESSDGKPVNIDKWEVYSLDNKNNQSNNDASENEQDDGLSEKQKPLVVSEIDNPQFELPKGQYRVDATYQNKKYSQEVDLPIGPMTQLDLIIPNDKEITFSLHSESQGPAIKADKWEIFHSDLESAALNNPIASAGNNQIKPKFTLPHGEFEAKVTLDGLSHKEPFTVTGDEITEQKIVVPFQNLILKAVTEKGGDPIAITAWEVYQVDPANGSDNLLYKKDGHIKMPTFKLLPGNYRIKATLDNVNIEQDVRVNATGEDTHVEIVIPVHKVKLKAAYNPDGEAIRAQSWEIYQHDPFLNDELLISSAGNNQLTPEFELPTGDYKLNIGLDDGNQINGLDLKVDKDGLVEFQLPKQSLKLSAVTQPDTDPIAVDEWQVIANDPLSDKPITDPDSSSNAIISKEKSPLISLPPGQYTVNAIINGQKFIQPLELKAGQQLNTEFLIPTSVCLIVTTRESDSGKEIIPDTWEIYKHQAAEDNFVLLKDNPGYKVHLVEPGKYKIKVSKDEKVAEKSITIGGDQHHVMTEIHIPGSNSTDSQDHANPSDPPSIDSQDQANPSDLNSSNSQTTPQLGRLNLSVADNEKSNQLKILAWKVYQSIDNDEDKSKKLIFTSTERNVKDIELEPGDYKVEVKSTDNQLAEKLVQIKPAESTTLTITFD